MKNIQIASDIIPLSEFKTGLSACMKKVQATGPSSDYYPERQTCRCIAFAR
jgi:hypothetical protein